ncbi:hypothetical protein [Shewanella surugensis]|uniref:Uncharacterized protein n=1 Tax=Shewanella surugensis TaxID=212020 RepID=A0ABT0LJJ8_9GAMM|nr:hypothetical protein [Shewanella surugensis]MCL1127296.1 hypothetical protein [Shewanella surugensis]
MASIPVFEQQINIIACDIEVEHLQYIDDSLPIHLKPYLTKKVAEFPNEVEFDSNSVGAVLMSHILPFLTPSQLDEVFVKLACWMKPTLK